MRIKDDGLKSNENEEDLKRTNFKRDSEKAGKEKFQNFRWLLKIKIGCFLIGNS